jgi:hypothetical protein
MNKAQYAVYDVYKPETNYIKLSTPFLVKSRCKFCRGLPMHYYYIKSRGLYQDPSKLVQWFQDVSKHFKRMCTEHYFLSEPRYCGGMANFSQTPFYKGYNPTLHRTRGVSNSSEMSEFLMCECGGTSWAFRNKAVKNRPEIVNRKSRKNFPQKFEF